MFDHIMILSACRRAYHSAYICVAAHGKSEKRAAKMANNQKISKHRKKKNSGRVNKAKNGEKISASHDVA